MPRETTLSKWESMTVHVSPVSPLSERVNRSVSLNYTNFIEYSSTQRCSLIFPQPLQKRLWIKELTSHRQCFMKGTGIKFTPWQDVSGLNLAQQLQKTGETQAKKGESVWHRRANQVGKVPEGCSYTDIFLKTRLV